MTEFTASNGVTVKKYGAGLYLTGDPVEFDRLREKLQAGSYGDITPSMQDALREFFQNERDEELGRWRYPEDPRYVVYGGYSPGEERRFARVVQEQMGIVSIVYEGKDHQSEVHDIAVAFFEAHPERKPWQDAKPGDLWVLTLDGGETRAAAVRRRLEDGIAHWIGEGISTYDLTDHHITAGRRIWPEGDVS